jgi:hypothetical protein
MQHIIRNIQYILVILFCGFLLKCTNSPTIADKTPVTTIKLEAQKSNNIKKMSEIFNIHKYITLEISDSCIIGEISKIIVADNCFWILDKVSMSVFCFDITGKFIFKINSIGKGPSEYKRITNIAYRNNRLFIFESGHQILEYDAKGKFISRIGTKLYASEFDAIDSSNYIFYGNFMPNKIPYNVFITDNKLNIKKTYLSTLRITEGNSFVKKIMNSSNFSDTITIWEQYNDTIYQFNEGRLSKKFLIDYSNNNPEVASKILKMVNSKNSNASIVYKYEKEKNYCNLMYVQETVNHFFILYQQDNYYHYVFYEKKTGKSIDLRKEMSDESTDPPLVNDLDGGKYYLYYASDRDYIYSVINPYELINSSLSNKALEEVKSKLDENGNPVIVLLSLKDFN